MKKILIVLPLIITASLFGQLRVSADMAGTTEMSGSASGISISVEADSKLGFTLGYDHMLGDASGLDYGAGLEYQLNRGIELAGNEGGKFGFTSIYGVGKYNINESMYASLRVGYAIMFSGDDDFKGDADLKGGIMYGTGFGYNINDQMAVEAGWNSNAGTAETSGLTLDVSYTRLAVSFLYSF